MDKRNSLNFLEKCLDYVKGLSEEEALKFFKDDKGIDKEYSDSQFEIIFPFTENDDIESYTYHSVIQCSNIDFNTVNSYDNLINDKVTLDENYCKAS